MVTRVSPPPPAVFALCFYFTTLLRDYCQINHTRHDPNAFFLFVAFLSAHANTFILGSRRGIHRKISVRRVRDRPCYAVYIYIPPVGYYMITVIPKQSRNGLVNARDFCCLGVRRCLSPSWTPCLGLFFFFAAIFIYISWTYCTAYSTSYPTDAIFLSLNPAGLRRVFFFFCSFSLLGCCVALLSVLIFFLFLDVGYETKAGVLQAHACAVGDLQDGAVAAGVQAAGCVSSACLLGGPPARLRRRRWVRWPGVCVLGGDVACPNADMIGDVALPERR